jgi:hypothetical protein
MPEHTRRSEYEATGFRRTATAAARGRGEDLAGGEATHRRPPWQPLGDNHKGNIGIGPEEADGDVDWPGREWMEKSWRRIVRDHVWSKG